MKNSLRQILGSATLLCCALGAQAAGSLVLSPVLTTVAPGDSFALQVRGSGFVDNVVGGGFNLSFDPGVLMLTGVAVDTVVWEFASSSGLTDNVLGTLSDVYFNSFRAVLPTGDFSVATLQFTARAAGSSEVQLSASPSFPFANDLAEVIAVDYLSAGVNVTAVPEPGSLALMTLGLLAFSLRRWQRA